MDTFPYKRDGAAYIYKGNLEGCAQTAAVGDPVELVGLLFFLFS